MTHFAYLDEAGISGSDPVSVVAGPIFDSRNPIPLQNHMRQMLQRFLKPETLPSNFVVSAKDLFHGSKSFKDGNVWPLSRRLEILDSILSVPRIFDFTLVVGWYRRDPAEEKALAPLQRVINAHARAFLLAAIPIERFMRECTSTNSVATMIVENNNETHSAVQRMQRYIRSELYVNEKIDRQLHDYLPLTKILEDPLIADKAWSNNLLIADACAFSFARFYSGRSRADELLEKLLGDVRPTFPASHQAGHEYLKPSPLDENGLT